MWTCVGLCGPAPRQPGRGRSRPASRPGSEFAPPAAADGEGAVITGSQDVGAEWADGGGWSPVSPPSAWTAPEPGTRRSLGSESGGHHSSVG